MTWREIAGPGTPGLAIDPSKPVRVIATRCSCAHNLDGTVTRLLCPLHADTDPCLTESWVTGRRRKGSIRRGVCSACGHGGTR